MPNVVVIRPEISDQEREKRIEEIESILSKILKTPVKLVDKTPKEDLDNELCDRVWQPKRKGKKHLEGNIGRKADPAASGRS